MVNRGKDAHLVESVVFLFSGQFAQANLNGKHKVSIILSSNFSTDTVSASL
jgi:hypothetical protein